MQNFNLPSIQVRFLLLVLSILSGQLLFAQNDYCTFGAQFSALNGSRTTGISSSVADIAQVMENKNCTGAILYITVPGLTGADKISIHQGDSPTNPVLYEAANPTFIRLPRREALFHTLAVPLKINGKFTIRVEGMRGQVRIRKFRQYSARMGFHYFLNGKWERDGNGFIQAAVFASKNRTISSVKSGSWTDPSVWDCNCVPSSGHDIVIKTGHQVVFRNPAANLALESNQFVNVEAGGGLTIASAGHHDLQGILDIVGELNIREHATVEINGSLVLQSTGSLTNQGTLSLPAGKSISGGQLVKNTGTLTLSPSAAGPQISGAATFEAGGMLQTIGSSRPPNGQTWPMITATTITGTFANTDMACMDVAMTNGIAVQGNTSKTSYRDNDGDGFGDPAITSTTCPPPAGYVNNDSDCDDTNASITTGATWYADTDGDGFGDPATTTNSCTQPNGYVANSDDHLPNNGAAYPGAPEVAGNGIDENGNGTVDERILFVDASASGAGTGASASDAITNLQDAITNAAATVSAHPGGVELWVVGGTYTPPSTAGFTLENNVRIYGGFSGIETQRTQRNLAANPTTLSGSATNAIHVINGNGLDESAVLDGFIIEG
ncbi:MAG: hypothetical protein AAGF89_06670, partial [Bacteroidota bacterium]